MISSAANYPVSVLFGVSAGVIYKVPRYQREYAWKYAQWESLFDDILDNEPGYFLGSIICISNHRDAYSVNELEVVDGQQRLLTISLLYSAIYNVLHTAESVLGVQLQSALVDLPRIILYSRQNLLRVNPQIQNRNLDDYRGLLSEIGILDGYSSPTFAGNRRIYRAFKFFRYLLKRLIEQHNGEINILEDFIHKLNQACMIKIEVSSSSDAYLLFESLNNRGIPLTAIDIIKNKLLASLESEDESANSVTYNNWNQLLTLISDDYTTQERFFRQYYNAFKNELLDVQQVPIATRSNLIQVYERLIDNDAEAFFEGLRNAGRIYSRILVQDEDDQDDILKTPLCKLERIKGAPSYLLLLYLLRERANLDIQDEDIRIIVEFLIRFFVRRNLTDTPPTRDLIRLFMSVVNEVSTLRGRQVREKIESVLINVSASDNTFRERLQGQIYQDNVDVTRFILCSIEEDHMTRETTRNLWEKVKKKFVWSIEHILPQGENLPTIWLEMLAAESREQALELQQSFTHKLGNLSLSGYNSALGNMGFIDKRDKQNRNHDYVGYRNGLWLNRNLAQADHWSIEDIDKRTAELTEEALRLFSLNE